MDSFFLLWVASFICFLICLFTIIKDFIELKFDLILQQLAYLNTMVYNMNRHPREYAQDNDFLGLPRRKPVVHQLSLPGLEITPNVHDEVYKNRQTVMKKWSIDPHYE